MFFNSYILPIFDYADIIWGVLNHDYNTRYKEIMYVLRIFQIETGVFGLRQILPRTNGII